MPEQTKAASQEQTVDRHRTPAPMITLPTFAMPFPSGSTNPGMDRARAEMWSWLDAHHLVPTPESRRHLERTRPELTSAYYHARSDPRVLSVQTQCMAWAFLVDDEFDDGPAGRDTARCREAVTSLLGVVHGNPGRNPLAVAFAELWPRLAEGRSASWRRAFTDDLTAWLWTYYAETADRASSRVPTIAEYPEHRRHSVAELTFFDLCELGRDIDLPETIRRLPSFIRLRNAAAEQIGLFNDICSAAKERAAGYFHNAVCIIHHHQRCTLADAITTVNTMTTDRVQRMIAARSALDVDLAAGSLSLADQRAATTAADDIITLVRGNFDYHFEVDRYTAPEKVEVGAPLYVSRLFDSD